MCAKAHHAIRAAENRASWGEYAAARYAAKHGVSNLFRLACSLADEE